MDDKSSTPIDWRYRVIATITEDYTDPSKVSTVKKDPFGHKPPLLGIE